MSGPRRWACAAVVGVALVAAVGCKITDLSLLAVLHGTTNNDRVMTGSLDVVAAALQADLGKIGLVATITPEGEAVRIRSTTRTGQRFSLVLTRVQNAVGEQTNVHFEWEGKPDEHTESLLFGQMEMHRTP